MILASTQFERFAPAIASLPDHTPLTKADLLQPSLRLHSEQTKKGLLEIYYSPIDVVNAQAQLVLIGICPGFAPMQLAYQEAARGLRAGLPRDIIQEQAKRRAQWVGQTRVNLAAMLDALDVPAHLSVPSALALFDTHAHLLHSCAAIRYPVFVDGLNYSGYGPDMLKTPALRRYIETTLPETFQHIGKAVVVLLGRSVSEAVQAVIGEELRRHDRLVLSLPHPSAGPGAQQRRQQFTDRRPNLKQTVQAWYANGHL